MEITYQEVLTEEKISVDSLPEKVKTMIKDLNATKNSYLSKDKKTGELKDGAKRKIEVYNESIIREIYKYQDQVESNKKPSEKEDDKNAPKLTPEQENLLAIETGLNDLFTSDKKEFTIEEIKSISKPIYDVLFESYSPNEDNGIETSRYCLIEDKTTKLFTIKKI